MIQQLKTLSAVCKGRDDEDPHLLGEFSECLVRSGLQALDGLFDIGILDFITMLHLPLSHTL